MDIKTKFNVGETVFTMENNEIKQIKIDKIIATIDNCDGKNRIKVKYLRLYNPRGRDMEYDEEFLFHTVDEVISHLLSIYNKH